MKYGCAFSPRPSPGRCVKDPGSSKVDSQCQAIDGVCRLVGASIPQKPVEEKKIQPQIQSQTTAQIKYNGKISGPISAYATELGKSYNFFGDAHFSMTKTCKPCKDIKVPSLQVVNPQNADNCYDISLLLAEVFTKASEERKWIDFYIEIPFLTTNQNNFKPSSSDISDGIDQFGYIYKLYYIFYNCLNKAGCKYDTTRFHYVDVRLEYQKSDLKGLTEEMKQIIEMSGQKLPPRYSTSFIVYESYVSTIRVREAMQEFAKMVMQKERKRNSYIEETDKLMRELYFSGGQTMAGKIDPKNFRLFKLYLTSDNFAEDAANLIESKTVDSYKYLVPANLMVNRKGRNMHRIRSQLFALEEEGKGELVQKIVHYLINRYEKTVSNVAIIDLWRSLMIAYDGYLNSKYRSLEDVHFLLDKLSQEFNKLTKISSFTISGVSLLMDAYTLSRMFREFLGKNHIDSSKSIVYAGDAHISTYVDFFEKELGAPFNKYDPNKDKLKNYESLLRCIDVNLDDFKKI